jgi:teichuronic acid biosynthesis glycosyltransferase TuaC
MNVLFVASGNSINFKMAPFIYNQGESLKSEGENVEYFTIKGKGLLGYIKGARELRRFLKNNKYDIIHAHYTLSGWSTVLAFPKTPVVLSLMGSDAYGEYIGHNKIKFSSRYLIALTYLIQPFVKAIICKTKHIQDFIYLKKKSHVIPNGILLDTIIQNSDGYRDELKLKTDRKYVLFLGNKEEMRKNFVVVKKALELLNDNRNELLSPYPVSHDVAIKYMNTADVLVAPSFMEGSPNVIKEAMACNCPVVATDVGDVKWLFGNEPGYFVTGFEPEEVAENIGKALRFAEIHNKTNGRNRIIDLKLDSKSVAQRIIDVYSSVL